MSIAFELSSFVKRHWVSLSLLLAVYGAVFLSSVMLSGWTLADWGKDLTIYPLMIAPLLPVAWLAPIFFVTSIPALMIGTVGLCAYSIRGINANVVDNKEHVAILLTACGFLYQVVGAWPLGNIVNFPWQWQKDIASNPSLLVWTLYLLSLGALLVGASSLFIHSRIYHQKQRSLN